MVVMKNAWARIQDMITDARDEVLKDDAYWSELAVGQDTEEAEQSGWLNGYLEGLKAALKVLEESDES